MSDKRSPFTHKIHEWGHQFNAHVKRNGGSGIETSKMYGGYTNGQARGEAWSIEKDQERAAYHRNQYDDKMRKAHEQNIADLEWDLKMKYGDMIKSKK